MAVTPYYTPEGGGLERYAHGILSRLAAAGHGVEAVCFTIGDPADTVEGAVRVRRLRARYKAGNTPLDTAFASRMREALREHRPDVVVVHTPVPFPAQVAAWVARREGVPYAVTYHAGRLRGSSPWLDAVASIDRWTLERSMLARAAALIAVGPYVRDQALARHKGRTHIVPPGVDVARFLPAPHPAREPVVLFVGPLSSSYRWKGLDVLWDAFQLVRERFPGARLRLVGEGDRLGEFRAKAATMDGAVEVLGRVPEASLPQLYRDAATTVLPSLTDAESFGMVLAEANACGRPVVASRIGGIPDFVVDGENGLLAHPGDAYDLAEKILMVLEDPDEGHRMGERGRRRVQKSHDWGDLARRTEGILAAAVAKS